MDTVNIAQKCITTDRITLPALRNLAPVRAINMLDNRRDEAATKARKFESPRSKVTILGHQFLTGRDKNLLIGQVYADAKGMCCMCWRKREIWKVDLDHIASGTKHSRCDCYKTMLADGSIHTNVRIICTMNPEKGIQSNCHQLRHNREPRLRRIA